MSPCLACVASYNIMVSNKTMVIKKLVLKKSRIKSFQCKKAEDERICFNLPVSTTINLNISGYGFYSWGEMS